MTKYCMFCGEKLPDTAQFCPSCGQKQTSVKEEKKQSSLIDEFEEEEDSAELDLLSQMGFAPQIQHKKKVKPPFQPTETKEIISTHIKEEFVKNDDIIDEPKETYKQEELVNKESEEENILPVVEKKQEKLVEKIEPEKTIIKNNAKTTFIKPPTLVQPKNVSAPQKQMPFQPTKEIKEENVMPVKMSSEEDIKYDLPDNFTISDETKSEELSLEEIKKEEDIKQSIKTEPSKPEAIASKRRHSVIRKRKEITINEEENFNTELKDNDKSAFETESLYADEVQENKRRKEISVDEEETTPERRRHSEGRKQPKNDTKKRRSSARDDVINKKIYDIEHDLSEIDPEELEYDGYYENVLPIDFGQIQKKKIDPKVIILSLVAIGIIVGCVFAVTLLLKI